MSAPPPATPPRGVAAWRLHASDPRSRPPCPPGGVAAASVPPFCRSCLLRFAPHISAAFARALRAALVPPPSGRCALSAAKYPRPASSRISPPNPPDREKTRKKPRSRITARFSPRGSSHGTTKALDTTQAMAALLAVTTVNWFLVENSLVVPSQF